MNNDLSSLELLLVLREDVASTKKKPVNREDIKLHEYIYKVDNNFEHIGTLNLQINTRVEKTNEGPMLLTLSSPFQHDTQPAIQVGNRTQYDLGCLVTTQVINCHQDTYRALIEQHLPAFWQLYQQTSKKEEYTPCERRIIMAYIPLFSKS